MKGIKPAVSKDKDITIIYGQHQGAETARIKNGIFRKIFNENTTRWKTIKNLIETNPARFKKLKLKLETHQNWIF